MDKIIHIIYIPMTGVGLHKGFRGNQWYEDRISIFLHYTLPSLLNQSEKDSFIIWISFRPEEENHPMTAYLANTMKERGARYILTFNGLMYHDDKFTYGYYGNIKNFGRVIRGRYRSKNWKDSIKSLKEVFDNKNDSLEERIRLSVKKISSALEKQEIKDIDWIYMTRIDSDDMFHKDSVKEIQSVAPFSGALRFQNGYIYDEERNLLAEYKPETNPPFHTIIFPSSIFFDAKLHKEYYGKFKSHEDIPEIFPSIRLSDGKYCVITHNISNHISTIWDHPFRGELVNDKDKILKEFGL